MRSLLSVCLFSLALVAANAETVDNPMYTPWKGFGAGSSATYKTVTSAGGVKNEITMVVTLVSINDTECVVSTENTMMVSGAEVKTPAYSTTIAAKIEIEKPTAEGSDTGSVKPKTETSQETLEIAGQKLECTKTAVTVETNGMKSESAYWTCTKVPGHTVKTSTKTSGAAESTMEMNLTAFVVK